MRDVKCDICGKKMSPDPRFDVEIDKQVFRVVGVAITNVTNNRPADVCKLCTKKIFSRKELVKKKVKK